MSVLLYVTWVLVFLQFRNLYVMCLVLLILKNALWICTWRILLLKSLWEELMMFLFLQIGIMCPEILLFFILIAIRLSPIILGRPFLRIIGAVIDMKEGNIKFQFPLMKGMEHFPIKELGHHMNQSWGHLMDLEPKMTKLRSLLYAYLRA